MKTPLKIVTFEGDIFKFKYAFTALNDFLGAKSLNIYEDLKMITWALLIEFVSETSSFELLKIFFRDFLKDATGNSIIVFAIEMIERRFWVVSKLDTFQREESIKEFSI